MLRYLLIVVIYSAFCPTLNVAAQDLYFYKHDNIQPVSNEIQVSYYKNGHRYSYDTRTNLSISFWLNINSLALSIDQLGELRSLIQSDRCDLFGGVCDPLALKKAQQLAASVNLRFIFKRNGKIYAQCTLPEAAYRYFGTHFEYSNSPQFILSPHILVGSLDGDVDYRTMCKSGSGKPIRSPKVLPRDSIIFAQGANNVIFAGRFKKVLNTKSP